MRDSYRVAALIRHSKLWHHCAVNIAAVIIFKTPFTEISNSSRLQNNLSTCDRSRAHLCSIEQVGSSQKDFWWCSLIRPLLEFVQPHTAVFARSLHSLLSVFGHFLIGALRLSAVRFDTPLQQETGMQVV